MDVIENTLLIYTLNIYPIVNPAIINVAHASTQLKLGCIKLWARLRIIGLVTRVIIKYTDGKSAKK